MQANSFQVWCLHWTVGTKKRETDWLITVALLPFQVKWETLFHREKPGGHPLVKEVDDNLNFGMDQETAGT